MTFSKIDNAWHDHKKIRKLSLSARGLWITALTWCGERLTDGFVPEDIVERWDQTLTVSSELVAAGLWEFVVVDGESGFAFHDYLDHQDRTKAQQQEWAERKRKQRARQREFTESQVSRRDIAVTVNGTHTNVTPLEKEREKEITTYAYNSNGLKLVEPSALLTMPFVANQSSQQAITKVQDEMARQIESGVNSWNLIEFILPLIDRFISTGDIDGASGLVCWYMGEAGTEQPSQADFTQAKRLLKRFGKEAVIGIDEATKWDIDNRWRYAEKVARLRFESKAT